jgi:hypothetical protein
MLQQAGDGLPPSWIFEPKDGSDDLASWASSFLSSLVASASPVSSLHNRLSNAYNDAQYDAQLCDTTKQRQHDDSL